MRKYIYGFVAILATSTVAALFYNPAVTSTVTPSAWNLSLKAPVVQFQPCVWPNRCAGNIAQFQTCVWPNKCVTTLKNI